MKLLKVLAFVLLPIGLFAQQKSDKTQDLKSKVEAQKKADLKATKLEQIRKDEAALKEEKRKKVEAENARVNAQARKKAAK